MARKSDNGLNFGPKFGDFPIQIPENVEKRPIFDDSYLGNRFKLRGK